MSLGDAGMADPSNSKALEAFGGFVTSIWGRDAEEEGAANNEMNSVRLYAASWHRTRIHLGI